MADLLDYTGQTVVLTGAASGIGAATGRALLDAGADVHAIDITEVPLAVPAAHRCNLGDPAAVADVAERLPDHIDVLMNCAGVPGGTRFEPVEVMRINFLGLRTLTEALLERLSPGGSVVHVASIAGVTWPGNAAELATLIATEDFAAGEAWCREHLGLIGDGYTLSKEAVQYYTLVRSVSCIRRGVRMNCLCPGVTETPILPEFRQAMGPSVIDLITDSAIGRAARPEEMAPAMLFLGHRAAASYVNGVNLNADGGFLAAMRTRQVSWNDAAPGPGVG